MSRPVRRPALAWLPALALVGMVAGCQGRCEVACTHVLETCGIQEYGWDDDTCRDLCLDRRTALEDTEAEEAFEAELDCLIGSSCDELRAESRACTDDALSPW